MKQSRLQIWRAGVAGVLALASAGAVVSADESGRFQGNWIIQFSKPAPWSGPNHRPEPHEPRRLVGKTITFSRTRVQGPSPLGCANPVYKVDVVEADMIFEGMLAEPRGGKPADAISNARKLGFADPHHIATLDAGCTEVQFHEVAPGTLVFGLNNRVYTMTHK
jgi:hypothetical protein